jgi:hypothetical protein
MVVHDPYEQDGLLERRRRDLKARLARETRVGWPALAAILMFIVIGTELVAYLLLEAGGGR